MPKTSDRAANQPRLIVRQATMADVAAIIELNRKIYGSFACTPDMVRGQLTHFPRGQIVVEYEGLIVGHCATFRIDESIALAAHSWKEITGGGFASRHDPKGNYLYGMEVCVDPQMRGKRIGQRLYQARKSLCQKLGLEGIVFGGRIPGYARYAKRHHVTAEQYVNLVLERQARDQVINFQLSNDFEIIGVLPDYLPVDAESAGYATHMVWYNPKIAEDARMREVQKRGRLADSVRVATVQYQMRRVASIDEFEQQVEYFVETASDYGSDFVVFPEMLTLQLLSAATQRLRPEEAVREIAGYTERFIAFMTAKAMRYNIHIIGGSHPTRMPDGQMQNIAYVFLRDGSVHAQPKLHPTPNERYWWNMKGGSGAHVIPTDRGPIGVMICYDSEFPEMARHLVDQGALILFVPFCTDTREGYLRVRYCCQARAVENQCYVVTSGVVGNLPNVDNMDIHYAESGIFTPCDFPFARDGIAAIAPTNSETITLADLRLQDLISARNSGTVMNLHDRRFDLYRVEWKEQGVEGPNPNPLPPGAQGTGTRG
jgi:predicted amidohydrolase/predicted N-acetyltransferase YhbS